MIGVKCGASSVGRQYAAPCGFRTTGKTHPSLVLTNFNRHIFSRSAPKHPENDNINMTNPMDKITTTGSSGIEVNSATSSKNPFSVQAQIPHVNKSSPRS